MKKAAKDHIPSLVDKFTIKDEPNRWVLQCPICKNRWALKKPTLAHPVHTGNVLTLLNHARSH